MAVPSVTYTFVNGTNADGTEVNTNFTDIINSLTDGTKDLTINALTTSSDITMGGVLFPDATSTRSLGSTTRAFVALYLDNGATDGGAIYANSGTTSFLKFNAAGTNLDVGGVTSITAPASKNHIHGWIKFNGQGSVSILDSFNVDSLDDDGTGDYGVNWDTDFLGNNYCCVGTCNDGVVEVDQPTSTATAEISVNNYSGAASDVSRISVLTVGERSQ